MKLKLHGYWRSTAAYRVRIAMALKGLSADQVIVDLREGVQSSPSFKAVNPQGLVPALDVDGRILIQSLPIIEWLEETFPTPALLPADPFGRAHVRAMAAVVASDVHPLNNLRVLTRLRSAFGSDEAEISAWISSWISEGFGALDGMLSDRGWSFGDRPGLADCCLVPQVYSADRFGVDLSPFPRVLRIASLAESHPAFVAAHPNQQPDAPARAV